MKIKKCTVCGKEFKSYNGREVCSDECFQKRKHEMEREGEERDYLAFLLHTLVRYAEKSFKV